MFKNYLKLFLIILIDAVIADVSLMLSFLLVETGSLSLDGQAILHALILFPAVLIMTFYLFRIYHIIWVLNSYRELLHIFVAVLVSSGAFVVVLRTLYRLSFSSVKFFSVLALIVFFFEFANRVITRRIKVFLSQKKKDNSSADSFQGNIMIIGAGDAAESIIREINRHDTAKNRKIKCLIDDDVTKQDNFLLGIKIVGGRNKIIESAKKYDISTIIFSIANCPAEEKAKILHLCKETGCELRTIPSYYSILSGDVDIASVRKVEIEDLLGRDSIDLKTEKCMTYVENQVVLVTGGGGSIGSELCRQIAGHRPKSLIVFDVYENNAYSIQNELKDKYPDLDLITLIGSVRDSKRMDCVFAKYRPDIVYHAAAHKHVPLMEDSPNESLKNNVFGTFKTAECAAKYSAKKFILISTDKAVNPTNIMGASKRICEMVVQYFNQHSQTDFVAVRFGNVLGSNGSVIPLFKKQIQNGGPVTVTDPNIIRYFMTIPEAVSLVIQAGASAKGGEIFVLDMGKPVKILDLAENLIKLSGFEPYTEIPIEFTGLRPGEKLYEELLMAEEGLTKTENSLIYIARPIEFEEDTFLQTLSEMRDRMYDDNADVRSLVKRLVPTYRHRV